MAQKFNTGHSENNFVVFIFAERTCNTQTTSLTVDVHTLHANQATRRNDKTKKQVCATMADSSFCVEAIAFTKVSGVLLQWVRYWLIEP